MSTTATTFDERPDRGRPDWFADVRAAQKSAFDRMNAITAKVAAAGRSALASEQREFDGLEVELKSLTEVAERHSVDYSQVIETWPGHRFESDSGEYRAGQPLTRGQSVEGYARARGLVREDEGHLSFGKYVRGIATGSWENADAERRAMAEGTTAAGGFLVPTLLSASIIDMVRNRTRVLQAGATLVPMENRTLDVPKWASDPAAAWHSENAVITASDPTLGRVQLVAQALASNVEVSVELLEDAPDVGDRLLEAFASVFALKLDLAALYGTGTAPEPLGIKTNTAVTKTSLGANGLAPANYDFLVDSAGRLADANEEPTGVIYADRTARTLAKMKASDSQPLLAPEYLQGIPRYATNQVSTTLTVGTSADTSDAFLADWRQLLVGVRTQLQIKVLSERYAENGQIGFIGWWRGDVAVARSKAFDVTTGIRP